MSKEELIKQLNLGMQFLLSDERLVLQLVYYEDLSYDEVCEVMDLPLGKVGVLLNNAKIKMRTFTPIFDDIDRQRKITIQRSFING